MVSGWDAWFFAFYFGIFVERGSALVVDAAFARKFLRFPDVTILVAEGWISSPMDKVAMDDFFYLQ